MKTFGELKVGDIFYEITWAGYHVDSIKAHKITDIVELKIGRLLHHGNRSKGENFGKTIQFDEYNSCRKNTFYHDDIPYFEVEICSDKEMLFKIIEDDKENFLNNYKKLLKHI